ncbi:hypothetical protein BV20DRAFT_1055380 [Pilatotrama ljubarskyi]|nr:hypothetical protein BV20DRAFT_1055380 [Pilatotrama ljubarskyi]
MAAARPKLAVVPSGADRAWRTADSTPSASSSFLDLRSSVIGPSAAGQSSAAVKSKATAGPQPNVKKMRRRVALLSGVHLNLPTSPVVGPSPPNSSREMAWTFTAEWDSTHDEIVFSEVESGSPSPSSSSSSPSLRLIASPVPFDVEEDEIFDLDVLSAPPVTTSPPQFSDMLSTSSSSSSSSAISSPSSPAVSDIFDFYAHTPGTPSFPNHERKGSVSTAPSSPPGPPSPAEQSPPSYPESRHDAPFISVTFFQESEDPARSGAVSLSMLRTGESSPEFDAYSVYSSLPEKRRALPPAPSPSRVARRPLPPVPIRTTPVPAASGFALGSLQRSDSSWDDRSAMASPQSMHSVRTAPPSAYSPPSPGPLHVRAASLGHGQADLPKRGVSLGKHFRSISAVLSGGLHRSHH